MNFGIFFFFFGGGWVNKVHSGLCENGESKKKKKKRIRLVSRMPTGDLHIIRKAHFKRNFQII